MAVISVTTLNLEAVTVNNDGINKIITINGNRSSLLFEYNQKAVITSYKIDQKEILDIAANGIYSALKHSGAWTTSLSLASSPIVNVIGNSVTATFSTSLADEIWTLNAFDSSIQFQMERKYKSALTLDEQGTPLMNFQKDIFENMRWLGDGGNFPLGGKASNQDFWLGTNSGTSVRAKGDPIFKSLNVTTGQIDSVSFTFTPDNYDSYFDLGTLYGIDEKSLSNAMNIFARWMMQDKKHGASAEASILKCEVPAIEQHWLVDIASTFGDTNAMNAFKNGLNDIRDYAQESNGHLNKVRPGTGDNWGKDYYDMPCAYVLAIAKVFANTGDTLWLGKMKSSAEKALDHLLANRWNQKNGLVYNIAQTGDWINDYWENSTGIYNGYIPAQGAALKSDLLSAVRKYDLVKGVETEEIEPNHLKIHPTCVRDLGNASNKVNRQKGEKNGGWYNSLWLGALVSVPCHSKLGF